MPTRSYDAPRGGAVPSIALGAAWEACAALLEAIQEAKGTELRLVEALGQREPGAVSGTAMGARLAEAALGLSLVLSPRLAGPRAGTGDGGLVEAAARLVGLGPGLTPSGDDFLCGLLAALRCVDGGGAGASIAADFASLAPIAWASTNAIGATYIAGALEGRFPPALLGLARSFAEARREEARIKLALERLCSFGHSSGADAATGFLFGLKGAMDGERRRYAR